jgi:hypothetical protein
MKRLLPAVVVLALLISVVPASATIITIDFEADGDLGDVADGFASADASWVHFSNTLNSGVRVSTAEDGQADGVSLINGGLGENQGDGNLSGIQIDFEFYVTSLSFDFGQDDPAFSSDGDLGLLTLFSGGVEVGESSLALNRNDLMDQTITSSGVAFHQATFFFTAPLGDPINLREIIDNIVVETNFEPAPFAVPEPSTLGLFAIGLIGLGVMSRRRRRYDQALS